MMPVTSEIRGLNEVIAKLKPQALLGRPLADF